MARDPDQIQQDIRALRQEISARVDNLKERGATDARDAVEGVKSVVSRTGVEDGMRENPYLWMGGAVAAGVVAGMASRSFHLPMPRIGGGAANGTGSEGTGPGLLGALIAAAEGLAVTEGRDAVQSWLRSANGHTKGPGEPEEPENELGTSIPPPSPVI